MLKKYIKPQTDTVKVQPQAILAGSENIVIKNEPINSNEMESKPNYYNVWED